jgi:DNA-binding IclR family transcriptional regulator
MPIKPSGQFVPALDRGLQILEHLATSQNGLTLSQLARNLKMPKSSVHRLLLTLKQHRFLCLDEATGHYRLGLHLFSLAHKALGGIHLRTLALPFIRTLMEKTGLTVHLAVFEHDEVIVIEKAQPPGGLPVATWVGKRLDLHCTALGKAYLAYRPDEEIDSLIKRHGLLRHNENTLVSVRRLKENLSLIRRKGYALDDEEEEIGIRCIGAPVFNGQLASVAAVSVVGSTARIGPEEVPHLSEQVKRTASAISQQLANSPYRQGDRE